MHWNHTELESTCAAHRCLFSENPTTASLSYCRTASHARWKSTPQQQKRTSSSRWANRQLPPPHQWWCCCFITVHALHQQQQRFPALFLTIPPRCCCRHDCTARPKPETTCCREQAPLFLRKMGGGYELELFTVELPVNLQASTLS